MTSEEQVKEDQNQPQELPQENQHELVTKEENTEILVKNIPEEATESLLMNTFEKYGKILNIKIDKDKEGKSLGSAIIQFETKQEKDEVFNLNEEIELKGKKLEVKDPINEQRTLFVGNIPYSSTEQDISNFFSDCGKVYVKFFYINKNFKGFAHVTFEDDNAVENALKKSGEKVGDRKIKIERIKPRSLIQEKRGGRRGGYQGRGRGRGRPYFGHSNKDRNNDYIRKRRDRYEDRDWPRRPYYREKDKYFVNKDWSRENKRERSRDKSIENNRMRERVDRERNNYHERDGDRDRHRYYEREREREDRIRNDRERNMRDRDRDRDGGGNRDKDRDRDNERHRDYERERGSRDRRHSNYERERERENGYRG